MDMIVCEECGAVVHPDFLQLHSDWHDLLLKTTDLASQKSTPLVRDIDPGIYYQDC